MQEGLDFHEYVIPQELVQSGPSQSRGFCLSKPQQALPANQQGPDDCRGPSFGKADLVARSSFHLPGLAETPTVHQTAETLGRHIGQEDEVRSDSVLRQHRCLDAHVVCSW